MGSRIGERSGFTILVTVLAVGMMLQPLVGATGLVNFGIRCTLVVVMLAAVRQLAWTNWVFPAATLVALVNFVFWYLGADPEVTRWVTVEHITALLFLSLVVTVLTRNVWYEREVRADTIVGGIAVYMIVGIIFSNAFMLIEYLSPGSFVVSSVGDAKWGPWEAETGQFPRLLFFSFVTLTTLGYGDVVPAGPVAAGLATLEAILGPLYLTVLVARLVGLHVASSHERGGPPAGNSPQSG